MTTTDLSLNFRLIWAELSFYKPTWKFTELTALEWPLYTCNFLPVLVSYRIAVLSLLPDRMYKFPLISVIAVDIIESVCPLNVVINSRVSVDYSLTFVSWPPVMKYLPVGQKLTDKMWPSWPLTSPFNFPENVSIN